MVSEHTNKMVVTIKYECIYFPGFVIKITRKVSRDPYSKNKIISGQGW